MSQTKTFDTGLMAEKLPIFKHLDSASLQKASGNVFKKGEKPLYNILRLAVVGGVGYGIVKYVIPTLFSVLAQTLAIVGVLGIIVFLFLARHAIFAGIRVIARNMHKIAINSDPFLELARQKAKMLANKVKFYQAKEKISNLETQMQTDSRTSERQAIALFESMESLSRRAKEIELELSNTNDEDVQHSLSLEQNQLASKVQNAMYKYNKANELTQKYGARAVIMTKLLRKLDWVANGIDAKILDFETTIDLLKDDYEYARKTAEATQAAKDTMLFEQAWELEYAMDVVTNAIASDNALTEMNLRDIDSLTTDLSIDNGAVFKKLEALTGRIHSGQEKITEAKPYTRVDYKLTQSDRQSTGGFGKGLF